MASWVLDYITMDEAQMRAFHFAVAIVGGLVGGFLIRIDWEMRRAAYFAAGATILGLTALLQAVWLGTEAAILGGFLGLFVAIDVAASLAAGFFTALIAKARSQNAFGTRGYAWAAFVPFLNLVLLLKSARKEAPPVGEGYNSALYVTWAVGALLVYVVFSAVLMERLNAQNEAIFADADRSAAVELAMTGVEGTLDQMVAEVTVPMRLDAVTVATKIERDGRTLRFVYDLDADSLPADHRRGVENHFCTDTAFRPLLRAGAAIELVYYRTGTGREVTRYRIIDDTC